MYPSTPQISLFLALFCPGRLHAISSLALAPSPLSSPIPWLKPYPTPVAIAVLPLATDQSPLSSPPALCLSLTNILRGPRFAAAGVYDLVNLPTLPYPTVCTYNALALKTP